MSCNTKTSLAAVIDAVNAQLNNNYVDRDDPRIDQGVFTEPTIRGGLMLDEAAKLDFCGYVTECGQREPFGKQWVDRPLYPHNTLVSYEDGGEIKSRWQDIDDVVAGTEIGESYIAYEETRSLGLQGYTIIDSFELGATITQRDQALRHAATGELYRWAGDLPKIVPAGSTPVSSGGVDTNAWLGVSDTALRQEILTGGLLTDTLVTMTANAEGAIARNLHDVNSDVLDLKSFLSPEQLADTQLETPILDHTQAVKSFINALNNKTYSAARLTGNLNVSESLLFIASKTKTLYFDATINTKDSGDVLITFDGIRSQVVTGRLLVTSNTTVYANRSWNTGIRLINCNGAAFSARMEALGFRVWGVDIRGGSEFGAGNSNSMAFGLVKSMYNGSGTSARGLDITRSDTATETMLNYTDTLHSLYQKPLVAIEYTSLDGKQRKAVVKAHDIVAKTITLNLIPYEFKNNKPLIYTSAISSNIINVVNAGVSTSQRSTITLDTPFIASDDLITRSGCVIVDAKPYRITAISGSTIEVYPTLPDVLISSRAHIIEGGGVRVIGSDANLLTFSKLAITGNAVGFHFANFYSTKISSMGAEFNSIATLFGQSPTGITMSNDVSSMYYEGNLLDAVVTSVSAFTSRVKLSVDADFNKIVQLYPVGSDALSSTHLEVEDRTGVYKYTGNNATGVTNNAVDIKLGNLNHVSIVSDSPVITLYDNPDLRSKFGMVDLHFTVFGIRENNSFSRDFTINVESGYKINAQDSLLVKAPKGALICHARLMGNRWRLTYVSTPLRSTRSVTVPTIEAKESTTMVTTVINASIGDIVSVTPTTPQVGIMFSAVVTAENEVTITAFNAGIAPFTSKSVGFNLLITN